VLSVKCCWCWECRPSVRVGVDRQPEYCENGDVYIPWIYVDFHAAIKLTLFSLPGVVRAPPSQCMALRPPHHQGVDGREGIGTVVLELITLSGSRKVCVVNLFHCLLCIMSDARRLFRPQHIALAMPPPLLQLTQTSIPVRSRKTAPSISPSKPPGVQARSSRPNAVCPRTLAMAQSSYSHQYSTTPPAAPFRENTPSPRRPKHSTRSLTSLNPTSQSTRPHYP
jgi:hypothetical protein